MTEISLAASKPFEENLFKLNDISFLIWKFCAQISFDLLNVCQTKNFSRDKVVNDDVLKYLETHIAAVAVGSIAGINIPGSSNSTAGNSADSTAGSTPGSTRRDPQSHIATDDKDKDNRPKFFKSLILKSAASKRERFSGIYYTLLFESKNGSRFEVVCAETGFYDKNDISDPRLNFSNLQDCLKSLCTDFKHDYEQITDFDIPLMFDYDKLAPPSFTTRVSCPVQGLKTYFESLFTKVHDWNLEFHAHFHAERVAKDRDEAQGNHELILRDEAVHDLACQMTRVAVRAVEGIIEGSIGPAGGSSGAPPGDTTGARAETQIENKPASRSSEVSSSSGDKPLVNGGGGVVNQKEKDKDEPFYITDNLFLSQSLVTASKDVRQINTVFLAGVGCLVVGTAVVEYLGRRFTAQCVIPGLLDRIDPANEDDLVVYGMDEDGVVKADPAVREMALRVAAIFGTKPHLFKDVELATPSTVKFIKSHGVNQGVYVIDMGAPACVDLNSVDEDELHLGTTRFKGMRVEMVDSFRRLKHAQGQGAESLFNPSAYFSNRPTDSEKRLLVEIGAHAMNLVEEMVQGMILITGPYDSRSLTKFLHDRGVGIWYLGIIKRLVSEKSGGEWARVQRLVEREMVSRACKCILRERISTLGFTAAPLEICLFLNGVFGKTGRERSKVCLLIKEKFRTTVSDLVFSHRPLLILESICQALGFQFCLRTFDFSLDLVFEPSDIVDVYPVTFTTDFTSFPRRVLDYGRVLVMSSSEEDQARGLELLVDAVAVYEQVYGRWESGLRDIKAVYALVAGVWASRSGDMAKAVAFQRLATIGTREAPRYFDLGYYEFMNGQIEEGLEDMCLGLEIWNKLDVDTHLLTAAVYGNIGSMLGRLEKYELSQKFWQGACRIHNCYTNGTSHLTRDDSNAARAIAHDNLTQAYISTGAWKKALDAQKVVYSYYKQKDAEKAQICKNIMNLLTEKAVELAVLAKGSKTMLETKQVVDYSVFPFNEFLAQSVTLSGANLAAAAKL